MVAFLVSVNGIKGRGLGPVKETFWPENERIRVLFRVKVDRVVIEDHAGVGRNEVAVPGFISDSVMRYSCQDTKRVLVSLSGNSDGKTIVQKKKKLPSGAGSLIRRASLMIARMYLRSGSSAEFGNLSLPTTRSSSS